MKKKTQTIIESINESKWKKYSAIGFGALLLLFILGLFIKPSAENVFKSALENMLQTDSVVIEQEYTGTGSQGESISMSTNSYLELVDENNLKIEGTFNLDLVSAGVPITATAEFAVIDGQNYVKFTKFTSSDASLAQNFQEIEHKLQNKWVKARDGDSFTSFVDGPVDSLTSITALPYANLSDGSKQEIVSLLQDEKSFTIEESAEVTINGVKAYRYVLEFDKEQQAEVSKKLSESVEYLSAGSADDESEIDSLELWVGINDMRFIKIEYSGTSDMGKIEAVTNFSKYGDKQSVSKPDDYFIESELLQ